MNKVYLSLLLLVLAIGESGAMTLFKNKNRINVGIGFTLYMITSLGLVYLVQHRGLAIGHALFDVSSIIIATVIGIYYFKEEIDYKKAFGIALAIISVGLLA